jgi:hypothetical protein
MLAYLLMCHRMPGAVADLLRAVWRPEHLYIVHVDAKAGEAVRATVAHFAALPNVYVLPAQFCSWGGWSLVEVLLRGAARAVAAGGDWSHLIVLSEAHLPLRPPEAMDFQRGVSRIDAAPVATTHALAQADVMHRLRARYRELPGVGMFPVGPATVSHTLMDALHHGTQWMVLAREACERLQSAGLDSPIWAPFRQSLIADETAVQTVLLGTEFGHGLVNDPRPTTFVAWPHVSGNGDFTHTAANFFAARDEGFRFIRKRPRTLSQPVAEIVEAMAMLPEFSPPDDSFVQGAAAARLGDSLHAMLRPMFDGLAVETLAPLRAGGSPACFLRLRCQALPRDLHVALLSEDFVTFKALLAWGGQPADEFGVRTLGGFPTWLLKVRLWDLFELREVMLPDPGFLTVALGEGPGRVAALLARVLQDGVDLAPAMPR